VKNRPVLSPLRDIRYSVVDPYPGMPPIGHYLVCGCADWNLILRLQVAGLPCHEQELSGLVRIRDVGV
jgi:hypothetical protein